MEENNPNEFYFTSQIYNKRTNRKYFDPNHYRFLFYKDMNICVKKLRFFLLHGLVFGLVAINHKPLLYFKGDTAQERVPGP